MSGGFEFAHPWFLLALLLVPGLVWLRGRRGGAAAITFPLHSGIEGGKPPRSSLRGPLLSMLILLPLILATLALARPRMFDMRTETRTSGVDIMLVLDVSRSMLAEDFTMDRRRSNRLQAVKGVTKDFISARVNDRLGIVAFAGRPYLVSPLTLNHAWLLENLERIKIGLVEDGTAIGSAIAVATNRLKRSEATSKVIVLLTDGDNNMGKIEPETAAEAAAALGVTIHVVGAGSRGMAPFPMQDIFGRTIYQNVPVEFDEDTMLRIAQIAGGRYFRATDTESLAKIFREIDMLERSEITVLQTREVEELFFWPLSIAFALAGLRVLLSEIVWRRLP